ncbi:MAG: hypothetical protein GQ537_03735 [Gammaproteobacteria bacterium]|nr:hypothetical protein [Gammaproteobacteria bacterium]
MTETATQQKNSHRKKAIPRCSNYWRVNRSKAPHADKHAGNGDSYEFFNMLTSPELLDQVEVLLPHHRERLSLNTLRFLAT